MSNKLLERFREYINTSQFNALRIGLASPEKIRSLSYGEVKKIETINYRTLKPERDGLFCARIFGPVKDWECNCGKYKRMKHRGITCEKCGVEVIQSRVRRERMGHIELVAPVCHIWYLKGIPSYLGLIMDMPIKDLERVIYFDAYMVIKQGQSPYPEKYLLTSAEYEGYVDANPEDSEFKADTGAEAVRIFLSAMEMGGEKYKLEEAYQKTSSVATRHKILRRIKVLKGLMQGNLRPEWMIMSILPVLPPDLRPLVPLEGGRFASSDLNELYRRVLNRNIRLQRLIEIQAPSVIIKNEKRMLQESVDALIDNGRRGQPVRGTNKRALKSLSEMLRGKQGRFRQNLLGKRVDYSGRSVIVVDPELRMDRCGLPKIMALELFKSHVYSGLLANEQAPNLRVAKRMVEEGVPEVWDVLEDVVKGYPVLLNRAPTLHRLGIQAFYPILVDGKAITIHPLVCSAYNADFDGDQMAVHIPLSENARKECEQLILSTKNILSASNGRPVTVPSQDMVLGLYYISKLRKNELGEGIVFANPDEVVSAYQMGKVHLHACIKVRVDGKLIDTGVGRVLLYKALPEGSKFEWINKVMKKSYLAKLVDQVYMKFGSEATVKCLDGIKKLGFYNSTMAGISFPIDNLIVPKKKDAILENAEKEVQNIEELYLDGVITNGERNNKVLSLWSKATSDVADQVFKELEKLDNEAYLNEDKAFTPFNAIYMMLFSGARSSKEQIRQLVGMRGLMAKPSGEIMETPVKNNFKEGLGVFEYFISTHGARKGQADTALKTANSGYLTRRLVDVAQDLVVTMLDCQTLGSVKVKPLREGGDVIYDLAPRSFGRVAAADIKDPITGELIVKQGEIIGRETLDKINDSAITQVVIRSPLACQAKRGICAACYGLDLSKGAMVDIGTAVGIIAAQSIGEPGTQLTMRTFHIGGIASVDEQSDYDAKYDGIIQLRNVRTVTNKEGQTLVLSRKALIIILSPDGRELQRYDIEYGAQLFINDEQSIKAGDRIAEWDIHNKVLISEKGGTVKYQDLIDNITVQDQYDETTKRSAKVVIEHKSDTYQPSLSIVNDKGEEVAHYFLPTDAHLTVEDGKKIAVGDILMKVPRETTKSQDITTGGLPRIAELFEARMPKDPAILADIDGEVVFGGITRGQRKITVTDGDQSFDYLIPRGRQVTVNNGEKVSAGDQITMGVPVLHDILRILGPETLQTYLVNQIQQIYRLQGIDINDRHIELIVRQMLRKVRVVEPGDTEFLVGDRVDRIHFKGVNESLQAEGKKAATANPVLMGITLASLGTESFISAASFQQTTLILAEAAIAGQVDYLYGLKENVIIGKLIPAGTGVQSFKKKYLDEISENKEPINAQVNTNS